MELNQLINQLLESGIVENQELAVTLLGSTEVSSEEKVKHIDNFIKEYTSGKVNFFSEEKAHLFEKWVEVYLPTVKDSIKNRVNKITWIKRL